MCCRGASSPALVLVSDGGSLVAGPGLGAAQRLSPSSQARHHVAKNPGRGTVPLGRLPRLHPACHAGLTPTLLWRARVKAEGTSATNTPL